MDATVDVIVESVKVVPHIESNNFILVKVHLLPFEEALQSFTLILVRVFFTMDANSIIMRSDVMRKVTVDYFMFRLFGHWVVE